MSTTHVQDTRGQRLTVNIRIGHVVHMEISYTARPTMTHNNSVNWTTTD